MKVTIFSHKELSNEEYHAETEHASGSYLWHLLMKSPAHAHYVDPDEDVNNRARHFEFGSCAHSNLLEKSTFDAEYLRQTMPTDKLPGTFLTTGAAYSSYLKKMGVKGYSGKSVSELADLVMQAIPPDEEVYVLDVINRKENEIAKETGRKLIRGDDFDACMKMRNVLLANNSFAQIINQGEPEVSIFAPYSGVDKENPIPVKVRMDFVHDWNIIDYKTTADASPEAFGRQAYNAGYYLKMALQHDVFALAYGRKPSRVVLLVQEKKFPYACAEYDMTPEQLALGRRLYREALQIHHACKTVDVWPTYGGGKAMKLQTPNFVKYMYKDIFNDSQ